MKKSNNKLFKDYLNQKMDQDQINEFEEMLKAESQLKKDFLLERSFYEVIQDSGRQELRDRFSRLEAERNTISIMPSQTEFDRKIRWVEKAAFMYQSNLNSSSLPVSDDTINDFLAGDEEGGVE